MNDPRNNALYQCVIKFNNTYGDLIFLIVAGEYMYVYIGIRHDICVCTPAM